MRPEIELLISKGRVPSSKNSVSTIQDWQETFEKIEAPISDDEAIALFELLPVVEDDCFGIAWSVVHLIETAPNWPIMQCLEKSDSPWIMRLRKTVGND